LSIENPYIDAGVARRFDLRRVRIERKRERGRAAYRQ